MNMFLIALSAIGGLLLLYFGAEYLVRGGSAIAARSRISPLVIGLTLVAFGTSAPELFVSACAALRGLGDVCVGNIVGSNICNIALILGLTALVAPIGVNPLILKRDLPVAVVASLLLTAVWWFCGGIGPVLGLVFLAGLVVYTVISVWSASDWAETLRPEMSSGAAWFGVVGGLIALIVGSRMLLAGAVAIEKRFGVPDEFVALTVIAVGTSLPELATSVIAARDGEADIALGNIIGSNIFNILGILGLSALLRPVTITGLSTVDFGMMIATAVLLWPLLGARGRLARAEGVILLLVYVGYLIWLVNSM